MVGYIGPNGAGKGSTIKILSGILTPDSGTVLVDGRVSYWNRINHVREIGVVFGQCSQLWWEVPIIDSFALLKDIYSISDICYKHNLEEFTGRDYHSICMGIYGNYDFSQLLSDRCSLFSNESICNSILYLVTPCISCFFWRMDDGKRHFWFYYKWKYCLWTVQTHQHL